MSNTNTNQPTVAQYLEALEVIASANESTLESVAKVASPDHAERLAVSGTMLARYVAREWRKGEEEAKARGQWTTAFESSMMAYGLEEYDSAIDQANQVSSYFDDCRDNTDQFGDITAENYDALVEDVSSNSH